MKGEELLDVIGKLDADLIIQVDEKRKRITWQKAAALAVCAAFVVLVALGIANLPMQGDQPKEGEILLEEKVPTEGTPVESTPTESTPVENVSVCYLTVDVNPSVRLEVEDGKITACVAVNDDAQPILADLELTGCTIQEALPQLLKALVERGYLAKEDQAPVLLLAAYGGDTAVEILETATQTAKESLNSQEISTYIVSQQVIDVEIVKRLAAQYGVSEGKMQYVLNLLAEENGADFGNAVSSTIVELFGMDIERRLIEPRYKVGEYDEYGEKVLYVGKTEHMNGYIPWDELPKDYRESLEELYSPEDLAILAKPREWTTVPNVVGLTEAEARALMNSRNIAVRVAYYDSDALRQAGYQDGMCYKQDIKPGMRWNSDASIIIFVLAADDSRDATDALGNLGIEIA